MKNLKEKSELLSATADSLKLVMEGNAELLPDVEKTIEFLEQQAVPVEPMAGRPPFPGYLPPEPPPSKLDKGLGYHMRNRPAAKRPIRKGMAKNPEWLKRNRWMGMGEAKRPKSMKREMPQKQDTRGHWEVGSEERNCQNCVHGDIWTEYGQQLVDCKLKNITEIVPDYQEWPSDGTVARICPKFETASNGSAHVEVDVDEAYSVCAEELDGVDCVYFNVAKAKGGWYMSAIVDSETGSFVDSLVIDDGPYSSEEKALWAGIEAAGEWMRNNDLFNFEYSTDLLDKVPKLKQSEAKEEGKIGIESEDEIPPGNVICPECDGDGHYILMGRDRDVLCDECDGKGYVPARGMKESKRPFVEARRPRREEPTAWREGVWRLFAYDPKSQTNEPVGEFSAADDVDVDELIVFMKDHIEGFDDNDYVVEGDRDGVWFAPKLSSGRDEPRYEYFDVPIPSYSWEFIPNRPLKEGMLDWVGSAWGAANSAYGAGKRYKAWKKKAYGKEEEPKKDDKKPEKKESHVHGPAEAGQHLEGDSLAQAFSDWRSGDAWVDGRGTYHLQSLNGRVAPWNREVKAQFSDVQEFDRAAMKGYETRHGQFGLEVRPSPPLREVDYTTRRDWVVTVYYGNNEMGSWEIENRTEREAEKEAEADIEREFPEYGQTLAVDWTLTPKGGLNETKKKKVR